MRLNAHDGDASRAHVLAPNRFHITTPGFQNGPSFTEGAAARHTEVNPKLLRHHGELRASLDLHRSEASIRQTPYSARSNRVVSFIRASANRGLTTTSATMLILIAISAEAANAGLALGNHCPPVR